MAINQINVAINQFLNNVLYGIEPVCTLLHLCICISLPVWQLGIIAHCSVELRKFQCWQWPLLL